MRHVLASLFSIAAMFLIGGTAVQADDFRYYPPGELFPGSGTGRKLDRQLYAPNIAFPLSVGSDHGDAQAYAGSQINNVRGGSNNAPENYVYPWRDVYCEARQWTMPLCPSGKGHQGVDIRPSSNRNDYWQAVAMDDGVVTSVTSNTTVTVRSDNGFYCRYLHMAKGSIRDAGISPNTRVKKGVTALGRVSNIMGGTPNTSIHLHFDCNKRVSNQAVFVPIYTSLISAYRKSMGLPNIDVGQALGTDSQREVGASLTGEDDHPTEVCGPTSDIETSGQFEFSSIWKHNCSVVGLVAQGPSRKFVYVHPRTAIKPLVQGDPVLFAGTFEDGKYRGEAKVYSSVCGTINFAVEGTVSADFRSVLLSGRQPIRDDKCATIDTKLVELPFTYDRHSLEGAEMPDASPPPVFASLDPSSSLAASPMLDLMFRNVLNRSYPKVAVKWLTRSVPVCWENPEAASLEDDALIKSAAIDSWDRAAERLSFEGWTKCVPGNQGIRIRISDEGPHTKGLGNELDGVEHGMVLNTSFKTWGQACLSSEGQRKSCIYSIAVHEFGHAIGFAHEQNRPDTPGECFERPQGSNGDTLLTPYDPSSVMNYCNPLYNNAGRLSELDTYSVQVVYDGRKP